MSMDDAISHALANIDPKLLTGPIASIVSVSGWVAACCGGWILITWCLARSIGAAPWGWRAWVLSASGVKDRPA